MATKTSLTMTMRDQGLKESTKSLTYINPNATDQQLLQTAILFSRISTNEFIAAERIDRKPLTNQGG